MNTRNSKTTHGCHVGDIVEVHFVGKLISLGVGSGVLTVMPIGSKYGSLVLEEFVHPAPEPQEENSDE